VAATRFPGLIWGAAALATLLLAPTLAYPLARDQGIFLYVAQSLLRGELPYRDAWELKPPGVHLVYAGLLAGFGLRPVVFCAADVVAAALTAGLLARLIRGEHGCRAGWLAAAWYAALHLRLGYANVAQPEGFAAPLLVGAMLLATGDRRTQPATLLAAGLLAGSAAMFKYTTAVAVLPALLAAALAGKRRPIRLAALAAGLLLVPLALAGWLMASRAWPAFVEIQRDFLPGHTAHARDAVDPLAVTGIAAFGEIPLLLALAAWRAPRSGTPALWLAAAWAGVVAQGKYWGYHAIPAMAPLAGLAAIGSDRLASGIAARWPKTSAWRPAILILPLLTAPLGRAESYAIAARLATGDLARDAYEARFGPPGRPHFSALGCRWVADYLRATTAPTDPVLQWGFDPLPLALAGRRSPTRFFFHQPLVAPWAPARWREEFLADLARDPPVVILVAHQDAVPAATGRSADSASLVAEFPELAALLHDRYRFDRRIEDFSCYRRVR